MITPIRSTARRVTPAALAMIVAAGLASPTLAQSDRAGVERPGPTDYVTADASIVTDATRAHPALWPTAASPAAMSDPATEAFVTDLMSRMTLEEKVGQTIQADIASIKPEDLLTYPLGSILAGGNSSPGGDERASPRAWLDLALAFRRAASERPGAKVPLIYGIDAVHGHNNVVGATLFPHNIGLGAARDPELVRKIGEATALEVAVTGADWTFGPTLAVPQDDRWGRAYEGYAENPEVQRSYAGPMTLGLQGELSADHPLTAGHIAGSAKHFLADGGTSGGHDQGDYQGEEQGLIQTHLGGYPQAIDAGVLSIMASFSSWNGVKHSGNQTLLTDVLRGPLGFDGFVVSDWNAQGQLPGCSNASCPLALNAGIDMFMAPDSWKPLYANTLAQARSGEISAARLDEAVRRILRAKVKAGLFETTRPVEGHFEALGSVEHRAIARQAVRESLVLLKNDGVLPIRAEARVLVAGDADDIGEASGGWTLTWQGTGNTRKDFPNAQSIWDGVQEAVQAGGGTATLSPDGSFSDTSAGKPDVAIVVFGETPYAEGYGDIDTLDYAPSGPLETLKRLKAAGIPTVSVFLSGRPLWVNPELNASDAFVAAWLPGSEGGGVADVLIGDTAGMARTDFRGTLSFSWPKDAAGAPLNIGQPGYDPLFAYGYGLSYAVPGTVGPVSEESGVSAEAANPDRYMVAGRLIPPWSLVLEDASGEFRLGVETRGTSPGGVVSVRSVDGEAQESARALTFTGAGSASIAGRPVDLVRQTSFGMALAFRYRIDGAPKGQVGVRLGAGAVDLTPVFEEAAVNTWRTVTINLSCLKAAGADVSAVGAPFVLETNDALQMSIEDVRLTPGGDGVCPAAVGAAR